MRDRIFYSICFGFVFGVLLRSFVFINVFTALWIGVVAFFVILIHLLILKNKWGIVAGFFVLMFSLGILRFHMVDKPAPEVFESQVGQKVFMSGVVVDEPSIGESNQKLTTEVQSAKPARAGGDKTEILVSTDLGTNYKYADKINFSGKLEKPANFITDQAKEFDYVNYLRKDGILYVMSYPKIEIVSRENGNKIKSFLFSVKEKFLEKMNLGIPHPESLLMGGLILGEKSSFDQALRQSFINTGTIHIIALSGYNVTIVALWVMGIMKIFSFLPKNLGIGTGIFAIFLFVIMTGGSSTAIRAGIMAILALVARATGRNYDVARALVLAGVFMIILNPFVLAYDVSFQLSFIATIAVIFFAPRIEKYFMWVTNSFKLRDIVSVTSAAYIFVMPFILYKMGNLSLVALPANILILPFIPATMFFGFLTGLAGFISPLIALPFDYISYGLLHYELAVIGFFSRLPFSAILISDFPLILTVLIYIFFAYIIFARKINLSDSNKEKLLEKPKLFSFNNLSSPIFFGVFILAVIASGFLYYNHFEKNLETQKKLQKLLSDSSLPVATLGIRTSEANCKNGILPDTACTPGAVFRDAIESDICVSGYTQTVRNVSLNLRKQVYDEYNVLYPEPRGAYEVDHLIPLELGGSNDIANLFLEAAKPTPGFHEKDLVENFLNQEVCAGRVDLTRAQYQIATDWTVVYNNLTPDQITALKQQYRNWSGN